MYERILRNAGHERRFTIRRATRSGWEVDDQRDDVILRRRFYGDWHRVERAQLTFDLEATALREAGWTESIGHADRRPHEIALE